MFSTLTFRWIQEKTEPKLDGLGGFYLSLLSGTTSICLSLLTAFLGLVNGIPGPSLSVLFVLSLYANIFIPYKVTIQQLTECSPVSSASAHSGARPRRVAADGKATAVPRGAQPGGGRLRRAGRGAVPRLPGGGPHQSDSGLRARLPLALPGAVPRDVHQLPNVSHGLAVKPNIVIPSIQDNLGKISLPLIYTY